MTIFSIIFLSLTYLQLSGLEDTVHSFAAPAQVFCKNLFNSPSDHVVFYQAIACGTAVKNSTYDILKVVSLWHLVVVSAGHFQVIQWVLSKLLPRSQRLHYLILLGFCFWTGAQPPLIRAYFELLTQAASTRFKLWIPRSYSILYSSCLALLCFPTWAGSWSLLLSWLCTLLVFLLNNQPKWIQALGISIGVYPIMLLFTPPHPLSFLFNLIFGPPLSIILFPLSLLMTVFPFLYHLADPLMNALLWLLPLLAGEPPENVRTLSPNSFQMTLSWGYVLLLQLWVIFKQRTESFHNAK